MKTKQLMMTAALGLAAASVSATPYSFDALGQTYTEDFNAYRGSSTTLPDLMFVSWDENRTSAPFQGVNTSAFTAYTSDDSDYSFGILERNPVDLRDARLFFEFTNDTEEAITGFNVSYDVEAWYIGEDRRNRIRLKYDTILDDPNRDTFQTDIFSTDNPSTTTDAGNVDGSLPDNRTTVSGFVDLTTLLLDEDEPSAGVFGPLAPGETAYFRWQFSNTVGDNDGDRSGLAINNISITAIPEPGTLLMALTGLAALQIVRRRKAKA